MKSSKIQHSKVVVIENTIKRLLNKGVGLKVESLRIIHRSLNELRVLSQVQDEQQIFKLI